jgi:uncharacterized protein
MPGQMLSLPKVALSLFLLIALSSCGSSKSEPKSDVGADSSPANGSTVAARPENEVFNRGLPTADLALTRGGQALLELKVEIAENPPAQATGLMNVRQLPAMAGMAFLFPGPIQSPFNMMNTLIPLDIAFWDEGMRIVEILHMNPCERHPCQTYTPSHRYIGALEVNQGLLESKGIRVGDRVALRRT